MAEHNNSKGRKEVDKVRIIIGGVVVLLVVVIAVLVWQLSKQKQEVPNVQPEESVAANIGSGKIGARDESEPEPSSLPESEPEEDAYDKYTYFVSMESSDWYFPSATEPGTNVVVSNSELNACKMYFEVIVDDTQEVVFNSSSQVLSPGETMKDIVLGKELESGTYPCTLIYHLLDPDTEEEYTTTVLGITITIQ